MTVLSHIVRYASAAFALVLLLVGPLKAQRATSHIPVDSVYAGDRFDLIVELGHDGLGESLFPHELIPDSLIAGNRMRLPIGDFLLLAVRSRGERQVSDGIRLDSVVYEATTFAIDTARVDAIPVGIIDGVDTTLVLADGAEIRVASLLGEANPELRDITDLALFPRSWWPWVLGLLLGLVAAWLVWRHVRSAQGPSADQVPAPAPVPPIEEALARLAELEAMDLRSVPDIKAWYIELTSILRTYFAERAEVHALEATTGELINDLMRLRADRPVPREWIEALHNVLDEADLVKFADMRPVVDKTQHLLRSSRETIEQTERAYRLAEDEARRREALAAEAYKPERAQQEAASATSSPEHEDTESTHHTPGKTP